jgi:3-hydroxyisobutyrate dehydrogenase-like beta-hydroxyacid dehydrogenase
MATRLIDAGHELCVWNRSRDRTAPLAARGACVAGSPREAADGAALVMTSLANDGAVRDVVLGKDGLAEGLARGAAHVSTSTISVDLARELEQAHGERGQDFVSATVLGRPPAAASGKLYVMAAGAPAVVEAARPVLEHLGQRLFVVGEQPWQSNLVKLSANFMVFSTIEQFAEVFALNEKAGIAPATVFDVLSSSFCSAPVHVNYGQMILDGHFSPAGGPMTLGAKDNELLLKAGDEFGTPLPIASLLRDRFIASFARGEGELDFCALSNRAREDAGLGPKT